MQARDFETVRRRALVWAPSTSQGYSKPPADALGLLHFDFWVHIVQNYSSRQLTDHADALPALAGLANEFHRATGGAYVAGLWKLDLIQGLSWVSQDLKHGGNSGYGQKHRSYAGQKFAILQLLKRRCAHRTTENVCFLLLESVEGADGTWRRIKRLEFTVEEKVKGTSR